MDCDFSADSDEAARPVSCRYPSIVSLGVVEITHRIDLHYVS